ncbi:heme-binding protein [Paraburkholderia bannensis]|uniref:heme-binding protein n=1 Tax=Paraburkholderia bannensis TaxID=765414 RepID=UPI002AC33C0A|nr:heme-binding protein [Paraburkholderia bannensis]
MKGRGSEGLSGKFDRQISGDDELVSFNASVARVLGETAVNVAARRGRPIAVSVVSVSGPLFYCALEGVPHDASEQIRRKQNTVLRFGSSSLEVGQTFDSAGLTLESQGLSPLEYSLVGGAIPLRLADVELVGVLSIVGADAIHDHALALEALRWHLGTTPIQTGTHALRSSRRSDPRVSL